MESSAAAAFTGFPSAGLKMLKDLSRHNDRDWFNERKATYVGDVDEPMRALMFALAAKCARAKIPLAPNPKQPTFRIYRDVRFSTDKSPYKTHVGAVLYRNGDKTVPGCVYVHVDPAAESFVASAFYHPEKETLTALRRGMLEAPFARCLATLAKRDLALDTSEALQRLPRDFAEHAGTKSEPYLKLKSVIVSRRLDAAALRDPGLVDTIFAFLKDAQPLLTWGWSVV